MMFWSITKNTRSTFFRSEMHSRIKFKKRNLNLTLMLIWRPLISNSLDLLLTRSKEKSRWCRSTLGFLPRDSCLFLRTSIHLGIKSSNSMDVLKMESNTKMVQQRISHSSKSGLTSRRVPRNGTGFWTNTSAAGTKTSSKASTSSQTQFWKTSKMRRVIVSKIMSAFSYQRLWVWAAAWCSCTSSRLTSLSVCLRSIACTSWHSFSQGSVLASWREWQTSKSLRFIRYSWTMSSVNITVYTRIKWLLRN